MKKILLCCIVVVLTMIICVVPSFAVEYKVYTDTELLFDPEGTLAGDPDMPGFTVYTPANFYAYSATDWHPLSDCFITFNWDGLDYTYSVFGYYDGVQYLAGDAQTTIGEYTIVSDVLSLDECISYLESATGVSFSVVSSDDVGVFDSLVSVFSVIFAWLPASVVTLIGIFWTGSALTPIGVLSVAGLSIGVILLVFSIISRFLKFRG